MGQDFNLRFTRYSLEDKQPTNNNQKKIEIIRTGVFTDPRYGKFNITKSMLEQMIENFKSNTRGIKPALDYGHDVEGVAAGWFNDLFLEGDSLMGVVELTASGNRSFEGKEYGYISADFDTDYVDNEEGKKHGCVLLGAALTNRPVIKGMAPVIQLSEKQQSKKGEKKMSDEEKAKMESMEKELSEMKAKLSQYKKLEEDMGVESVDELTTKFGEMKSKADNMALSEDDTHRKLSLSEKKNKDLLAKIDLMEKTSRFNTLLSEGKAVEGQRDAFIKGNMEEFIAKSAAIKLSEIGHGQNPSGDGELTEDDIHEKAVKLAEESKIQYKDAVAQVLKSIKK